MYQTSKKRPLLIQSKRGTTMVEVLVAVMIVMIIVVMFGKVIAASVSLYQKAADAIADTEAFDTEYYKTVSIDNRQDVEAADGAGDVTLILKEQGGTAEIKLPKGRVKKFTDEGEGRTGISRYSIYAAPASEENEEPEGE